MNSKYIAAIVIVLVVLSGGVLFMATNSGNNVNDPSVSQSTNGNEESDNLTSQYANLEGAQIGEVIDAQGQSEVTVEIDDFIFNTTVVTVSKGTTVTWINNGDARHDIATASSSGIQGVQSELLSTGESFSYTFDETGQFDYFCSPHPTQMRGVVVVK